MFKVSLDANADALYVQLGQQQVVGTVEIDVGTLVDVAADGRIVGIEVLRPARDWPLETVLQKFPVPDRERHLLAVMFGRRGRSPLESTYPGSSFGARVPAIA